MLSISLTAAGRSRSNAKRGWQRAKTMEIFLHDGATSFRFVVVGALESPAARELDRSWSTASSVMQGRKVVVDITELTAVDEEGLEVLNRMRDSGCQLYARHLPPVPELKHLAARPGEAETVPGTAGRWKRTLVRQVPSLLVLALFFLVARMIACDGRDHRLNFPGPGARRNEVRQVIGQAEQAVCLIQGTYAFHSEKDGSRMRRRNWFLYGDDTVLEKTFSGTGFLVSAGGDIMTNRHIAQPWLADQEAREISAAGYRARLTGLKAFFPGRQDPFVLKTVRVSAEADVALLRVDSAGPLPAHLEFDTGESAAPGEEIMLVGFPGGLGPSLGREGQTRLTGMPGAMDSTPERTAQSLAAQDLLQPFVSFGHVSNARPPVLTLAVQSSAGSSGSPVLNQSGKVVGVLSASLTRVEGGSLAVPVRLARKLLIQR